MVLQAYNPSGLCRLMANTTSKISQGQKKCSLMIKPLRKYHFVTWHFLAVALPLTFILALIQKPTQPRHIPEEDDGFVLKIQNQTDSTATLTIHVGKPLTTPSCLVYVSSTAGELLLGKLDSQSSYTFTIPASNESRTVRLYDPIHKRTITTLHQE